MYARVVCEPDINLGPGCCFARTSITSSCLPTGSRIIDRLIEKSQNTVGSMNKKLGPPEERESMTRTAYARLLFLGFAVVTWRKVGGGRRLYRKDASG